jgi:hypothetical protein
MDSEAQGKYMASNGLTYREICSKAEDEWRKLYDDGKWGPAKTKTDSRRPPTGFGANIAETEEAPATLIHQSIGQCFAPATPDHEAIHHWIGYQIQQLPHLWKAWTLVTWLSWKENSATA